jgi:hypothetical protein
MATRRGAVCGCQGSLMDFDPDDDPRRCLDCGGRTPPGKWRCQICQGAIDDRAARMRAVLEANRRQTSHTTPL